jgi:hypothetical protein
MKNIVFPSAPFTQEKMDDLLVQLRQSLESNLALLDTYEKQLAAFQKYITAFHPHFIVWLSAMQNSCVTVTGKDAASENILLEISEDHQSMLWDFMRQFQIDIMPNARNYIKLLPTIKLINMTMKLGVEHKNATGPALVIFLLEEMSKIFIPWMAEIAKEHRATDFTYTETHGEADVRHVDLARDAFWAEYALYENHIHTFDRVKLTFQNVEDLLYSIFSAD